MVIWIILFINFVIGHLWYQQSWFLKKKNTDYLFIIETLNLRTIIQHFYTIKSVYFNYKKIGRSKYGVGQHFEDSLYSLRLPLVPPLINISHQSFPNSFRLNVFFQSCSYGHRTNMKETIIYTQTFTVSYWSVSDILTNEQYGNL